MEIGKCTPIYTIKEVTRIKADLHKLKAYLEECPPELRGLTIHMDDFIELGRLGCPTKPDEFLKKYNIRLSLCGGHGAQPEPGFPEIETWTQYKQDLMFNNPHYTPTGPDF